MTDDPVGEARRLAQNIYVAFSNLRCNSAAADTTAPDALVALVERVVGEREDLYTAAAETNATVAKMQESLDAAIREKESARAYHEIELDNMRQERDKMKAAWYAVSEKASRYEAERDSNAELWATEKAARDDGGDAIVLLKKMLAEAQRERATEKAAREKAEAARDAGRGRGVPEMLTLTDEEIDRFRDTRDSYEDDLRAACALGAKRQRERDAEIARGYWCRSGEACGKDIAAAIEGEGKP